ncbi:hypothetical protein DRO58_09285 [Candidatus Bathyarchaeota archaeon]|nr:MAG: hypothetical protein DRO58_09285 [Candidatus Bathyarchaeota archaeon]
MFNTPRYYTDFQSFSRDPEVDAVSTYTPHHLHAPQTVAMAEAGKHVFIQETYGRKS